MPRGRPPIPRTKEEALKARREQIRKNVQAFRRRKQGRNGLNEHHAGKEQGGCTFVVEGLEPSRCQSRSQQIPSTTAPKAESAQHNDEQLPLVCCLEAPLQPLSASCHLDSSISLPPFINPAQSSLQQFASNIAYTFLPTPVAQHSTSTHWSQILPIFVNRDETLDLSIQVLCLLQYSYLSGDPQFKPHSHLIYTRALKSLQCALAQPDPNFREELFAAAMALSTYELLQGTTPQGRGWMYHMEGATSYLNIFPALDMCASSHQLFFHFLETVCIFDALGSRRPSCFSGSTWWKECVDRFGGEDYGPLLRMLTSLPGVLEQSDQLISSERSVDTVKAWTRLLRICLRLEDALSDWFRRIPENRSSDKAQTKGISRKLDSVLCPCFPLQTFDCPILFSSLQDARLYLLYWSSMILLYETITSLLRNLYNSLPWEDVVFIPVADSVNAVLSPQAYVASATTFANFILRSVPFYIDPRQGIIGRSLILLPLYIARNCFQHGDYGENARECDKWLEGLGQKEMSFGLRVKKGSDTC